MMDTPVELDKVREFLNNKEADRRLRLESRYRTALQDFQKIVEVIINRYNPDKIYQWGSLLHPDRFSEISDIDIAVEGIESYEQFSRMYGEIEPLSGLPIDLVQIEKIHPLHGESIRKKGVLVYERK